MNDPTHLQKLCRQHYPQLMHDGRFLHPTERAALSEIGISPHQWTWLIKGRSDLSDLNFETGIKLAELIGVSPTELISENQKSTSNE